MTRSVNIFVSSSGHIQNLGKQSKSDCKWMEPLNNNRKKREWSSNERMREVFVEKKGPFIWDDEL